MTARGRESSRPRTFGISTSFIYLVCALSLGSAIFPFVSLRIYDQAFSLASTDAFEVYGTTSSDEWKCPIGWTQERCEQRKKEFWTQIAVNEKIRGDMIRAARQRARHNVYRRKQTESLKQDHDEYFQSVQRAVRVADLNTHNNTLQLPFPPWANFSNNSFADFSILGFPKAGTSQLYKLLVSHPNVEPVFKRKEYCIDHGHFLDYTLPQNLANPKVLRDLNKNLFQYHKRLFKQRTDHDQDEGRNQNLHRQLLVNACLQPQEVEYSPDILPLETKLGDQTLDVPS